jgi:hypothetical protein
MKLVQKQFLKGSREFEIDDDTVNVRIKTPLKEEKMTVMLTILNPEPVVNGPLLEFHSRVKCGPLLSLLVNKPDSKTFDAFVDELKRRAHEEYNAFAGLKTATVPQGLAANSYEEPPDFDQPPSNRANRKPVNGESIDSSIQMLQQHLEIDEIQPFVDALQALKAEPENEEFFAQLVSAFSDLGAQQGAVLTYAPYVSVLLSDDSFGH